MKSMLQCRAEILKQIGNCPQCTSSASEQFWSAEIFPGEKSDEGYLASPGDLASIRYECGIEFAIDDDEHLISRSACTLAGATAASFFESEADALFEDQEEAA